MLWCYISILFLFILWWIDYRLVIMCSKEGEDKSHIVSKLLLHKKSIILKHSTKKYQEYLRNSFVSPVTSDAASVVDKDKWDSIKAICNCDYYASYRSRVRVVSSKRTGMGKSLFIQRMAEQLESVNCSKAAPIEVIIPIHGPIVTSDVILSLLKGHYRDNKCKIYHFDIAPSVSEC